MEWKPAVEHSIRQNGCRDNCGSCPLCTLTICTSCQQYEGALTTHCPQELYDEKAEDVYEGLLDFRFGNWVKGTKNRVTAGKLSNQIANEPLFLEILKNDETPPL